MNLTPLIRGASRGLIGLRSGQREREQIDKEDEQRQLRNMLAIYGERRQQESADALTGLREQQQQDRIADALRRQREEQTAAAQYEEAVRVLVAKGETPENARVIARDPTAVRERLRTPPPPTPRNIDPLSPEGIKAGSTREEALARIRARFREPPASDTPDFLRPNAIGNRAATLTQPWMQGGIEVSPGREPAEAAAQARRDIENKRRAAFEAERDELKALYGAAMDRAGDDAELKDRATRAYMAAQEQLGKKYRIGQP